MRNARIFPFGCEFLMPFLEPSELLTSDVGGADFILAANNTRSSFLDDLQELRKSGKLLAWWTIEDPNWFEAFLPQARLADFVFTTDQACVPRYREQLGHARVLWLPLACSPQHHRPEPSAADSTDFVVSGNWYDNEARRWSVRTVVDPLVRSRRSLTLYCYENLMWPAPYRRFWRGRTHYLTVSEQYRHGNVVLGLNNQRTGLDGRGPTVMTSMRTFEALACGRPLLAPYSDSYAALGLRHGDHLASVRTPKETIEWADRLLGAEGERIAASGREIVLSHHTYTKRLQTMADAVLNSAW